MLTGQEILTQVIGNTATGDSHKHKHRWSEFYHPDGTILGRTDGDEVESNNGPYQGKWTISGSEMCFDYVRSGDAGCWTISVEGNEITFYRKGKHRHQAATLLKGNPKNF